MSALRKIDIAERRDRLTVRHLLGASGSDIAEVARSVVGLHSSDPVSVFVGARARASALTPAGIEEALYEDRTVARVLGMRRTMFVVAVETVPVVHAGATRALASRERARTVRMLEEGGVTTDGARWLRTACRKTLAAIEELGPSTAAELTKVVPQLAKRCEDWSGGKLRGTFGASTRVLFLLATEGKIVRTRPRGSWTSTQYRWASTRDWLGIDMDALETDHAQGELARLWLSRFGPGTIEDLKWWTGWTVAATKRALSAVGAVEVDLDDATGYVLADDLERVRPPRKKVVFLPALDPTTMGWKRREWYLGPHGPALFDRNGNAGPTIWLDGRVIGGWTQRRDGEIAYRLLEDVGKGASASAANQARALADWLGDVRFIPRFRTPLETELSS